MKKRWLALLAALLALQAAALAETDWTGSVAAGRTFTVRAAYGGAVEQIFAEAGDMLSAGDALLKLSGEKIYAAQDGVAAAVLAEAGDDASAATERHGAAIVIEPKRKYVAYMTAEEEFRADGSNRISVGETMYLRCKEDGTHRGVGVVTAADGLTYTIECIGGEFSNGEVVYASRVSDVKKQQRAGIGTVVAAEAEQIFADGVVVNSYISTGDAVEEGQLLLETAAGACSGADWNGGVVSASEAGIVASILVAPGQSVSQDEAVALLTDPDDLRVEISVEEEDLSLVQVGDAVALRFEDGSTAMGTVAFVSYCPDENGGYAVEIRAETAKGLRLGQSVNVALTIE